MPYYPGSNILNQALRVINKQTLTYYAYSNRTLNSMGVWQITYATPVQVQGSFQPVERKLYEQLGLNLQKTYFYLYVPASILDLERGVSGDYFQFQGTDYQAQSVTPWFGIDGWVAVLTIATPTMGNGD